MLKFINSEKAQNFAKSSPYFLSYVVPVKIKVKILQNFVAYSEYRTRAIISCGLYIFYPISKDHFFVFKEVFQNLCVQERLPIKSGL